MQESLIQFGVALMLFLLSHAVPIRPAVRRSLVRLAGERGYLLGYSLLSLALLAWLIHAARTGPFILLWAAPAWLYWLPAAAMLPACILLAAGLTSPNPLSLGRGRGYDPAQPGIVTVTRHPLLWALALWAGAHAAVNGNLIAAVLFGTFLLLSLGGMVMLDRKHRRRLGEEAWGRLAGRTSLLPFAAVLSGRTRPDWRGLGWRRVLGGAALFLLLLALHRLVIGAPPLPAY